MSKLIRSMNKELCDYFLLPMIGKNTKDYYSFIASYLHVTDQVLLVQAISSTASSAIEHTYHPIPKKFEKDVDMFRLGLYSAMTDSTKELICKKSGLVWEMKDDTKNGKLVSDARLLALFRDKSLREELAGELGIDLRDVKGELLQPPKDNWFFSGEYDLNEEPLE